MGRVSVHVSIRNLLEPDRALKCDALVDTRSAYMVLPQAWKDNLGNLPTVRRVECETATQQLVNAEVCGPVEIRLEGFEPIYGEVLFLDMEPQNGVYEPLVGYIVLEQAQAAVDMLGHRLIHVKKADLKQTRTMADAESVEVHMPNIWNETWTFNAFAGLLTSAIAFDIQAQVDTPYSAVNRFSKASFLNAVLCLEAAANSCVARLQYPDIVVKRLDTAPAVDKYAILYKARFGKDIDRGSRPFQSVSKLFLLRNRYVHPKIKTSQMKITRQDDKDRMYEKPSEQASNTQSPEIPHDYDTWTGEHSRMIVKETIGFLNHFFADLCGLSREECTRFLAVHAKGPGGWATFLATHETELLRRVQEEYHLEVRFLAF